MREFISVHVSDRQPGVGTILLDREPTNALTRQAYRELAAAAAEVAGRDDIAAEAEAAEDLRRHALDAVAAIGKPTVAAVTGYALGAGLSLALCADWRVCGDNAKLGATEILAGLVPGGGGCARLARAVGPWRAKELTFSGRFVGAKEALTLRLVDDLVAPDHVFDEALSWANRFVDAPAAAVAGAKALIDGDLDSRAQQQRYGEVFAARTAG